MTYVYPNKQRWNLRQRKTKNDAGKDQDESAMDTTVTSTVSTEEPTPQTTPPKQQKRGAKRDGPKVQTNQSKRKATIKKASSTTNVRASNSADTMFTAVSSGKGALKVGRYLWLRSPWLHQMISQDLGKGPISSLSE